MKVKMHAKSFNHHNSKIFSVEIKNLEMEKSKILCLIMQCCQDSHKFINSLMKFTVF